MCTLVKNIDDLRVIGVSILSLLLFVGSMDQSWRLVLLEYYDEDGVHKLGKSRAAVLAINDINHG